MPRSRVALVTGGSRGIGRAIALRLAAEAFDVVVGYHREEAAAAGVVDEIRRADHKAEALSADVGIPSEARRLVSETVDRFGRLDVLVANAGICFFEELDSISEQSWSRVIDVNLGGTFFCAQAAARVMVDGGRGGRIIVISSIGARLGTVDQIPYNATKAGQLSIARSLAVTLAPHGITVNAVLPGTIETDINRGLLANPVARSTFISRIPANRIGEATDIAGITAFLVSDQARYITGAEVVVDGGASSSL